MPLVAVTEGEKQRLTASGVVALNEDKPSWANLVDGELVLEPECDVVSGPRPPQLVTLQLRGADSTVPLQVIVERSIEGACGIDFRAYPCGAETTPLPRDPATAFELCVVLDTRDPDEKVWVRATSDLPKTKLRKVPAPADGVSRLVLDEQDDALQVAIEATPHVVGTFRLDFDIYREDPRLVTDPIAEVRTVRFAFGDSQHRVDVELLDDSGAPLDRFPPVAEYASVTARARVWLLTPDGPSGRCVRVSQLDPDGAPPPNDRVKSPVRVAMGGVAFQGGVLCSDVTPELSVSVSPGLLGQHANAVQPARLRIDVCAMPPGATCDPGATGAATVDVPLAVVNTVDDIMVGQLPGAAACAVDGATMIVAGTSGNSVVAAQGWPTSAVSTVDTVAFEVLTSMVIDEAGTDHARVVALRQNELARLDRVGTAWAWTTLVAGPARSKAVAGFRAIAGHGVTHAAFLARDGSGVPVIRIACVVGTCATDVALPGAVQNITNPLGEVVALDVEADGVDDLLAVAINDAGTVRTWRVSLAQPFATTAAAISPSTPLTGTLQRLVFVADPITLASARLVALVRSSSLGILYDVSYVLPASISTGPQSLPYPSASALTVLSRTSQRDRLGITSTFGLDEVSLGPSSIRTLDPTRAELPPAEQQPLGGQYGDGLAACATSGTTVGGPRLIFIASDGTGPAGPASYRVIDADAAAGPWLDQGAP